MGTRGAITLVAKKKEKTVYNHFDSYPSGLGDILLKWLKANLHRIDEVIQQVEGLKAIDKSTKPTKDDIALLDERAKKAGADTFGDPRVSDGDDWYAVLRKCQGNLDLMLASGFYTDSSDFVMDSLFCEWAYVIDFDDGVFEVYKGFQTQKHDVGRFAARGGGGPYYPVKLVGSYGFDSLPEKLEAGYEEEEEDE